MEEHTFLFADLAGFVALTEAHGDEHAADLAAAFFDEVRSLLEPHDAAEVKTIGDAVMVRCTDPTRAVCLGVDLVEDVGGRPEFPTVRVGIHTGPAVERGGDWFGGAVNLAARIASEAGGGEVLLSETTRETTGKVEGIELRERGAERFRGLARPVQLYHAVRAGERAEGLPIDPVCRMAVDPADSAGALTHGGVIYHFCSFDCVQRFAGDPGAYAG